MGIDLESDVLAGIELAKVADRVTSFKTTGPDVPMVLVPEGMKLELPTSALVESDKRAEAPARLKGTAQHFELDSFVAHLNRFKVPESSVVFADPAGVKLTAVLNYATGPAVPKWGDHRAVYACPLSREWQTWMGAADKPFAQDDFAEFLESNRPDLVGPSLDDEPDAFPPPSYLLQLARFLRINVKSSYERSTNVTTGEASLVAKTEQDQSSTRIPTAFLIGIPVFEAGALYRVEARLRLAFVNGRPTFSFIFPGAGAVKRDAFGEVRQKVADGTGLPVFAGSPEQ